MQIPKSRYLYILAFLAVVGLLITAMIFEYVMMLEPCPLCITQRITFIILGLIALAAAIHNPTGRSLRSYGILMIVFAVVGVGLATRQLYLQGLPPEHAPACMPGIEYLVDILPMNELINIMFKGTGDCAKVQWHFLGLTIPGWTLITFIGYGIFGVLELIRKQDVAH
ncbi:MAG: disulfide bond formation protein B [Endozoicomonadaceae bacterium]|nr:disulfide bond formation protein B [Endozoicomonadaceae bacterium]